MKVVLNYEEILYKYRWARTRYARGLINLREAFSKYFVVRLRVAYFIREGCGLLRVKPT